MVVLCLLILLIVPAMVNSKEDISEFRRWCFYTNWAQYRSGEAQFFPKDVDPTLCTHISYAFADISNNKLSPYEWNDENSPWSQGMYSKVNELKLKNPSLKTLLGVGGWNMGSLPFIELVSNQYYRSNFTNSAVEFLRTNNFDGLDICWLFPTKRNGTLKDKENFGHLLQELKVAFKEEAINSGKEELILGIIVGSNKTMIDEAYDIHTINESVDIISILSYDLYTPDTSERVMHPSALYPGQFTTVIDEEMNVEFIVEYWHSLGIPKKKINIGIPFYGRSFRLENFTSNSSIIQEGIPSAGKGIQGIYTKINGFLAYYEICKIIESGSISHFIEDRGVPAISMGNQWIAFENIRSVKLKADFALRNNYGGLMLWSLDLDDFNGVCHGGQRYPLLNAVNNVTKYYNSMETTTMSGE